LIPKEDRKDCNASQDFGNGCCLWIPWVLSGKLPGLCRSAIHFSRIGKICSLCLSYHCCFVKLDIFKKTISKKGVFALFITYLGIGFAYFHDVKLGGEMVTWGAFLVFLSAVTYAIYLMGSGDLIPKIGTNLFTSLAMLISSIFVLIHFSISSDWNRFGEFNEHVYFLGFLLGIFTTVIPSYFISAGISEVGSGKASIVSSVGPVSTILLAYKFLGETIGLYQVLGTVLVMAGILLIAVGKEK
jgi:drug/metabolite transporter (DMT)-like permease